MVDTVTLELVNNRLDEIVREMQYSIFRTGYSTIIRESKDTSAGITTREGVVIGQEFRHPFHIGVFQPSVEAVLEYFPMDKIQEGDVFLMNDPYIGGSPHSPDFIVVNPVFFEDELVAFALNIAHKPDIGGLVPGTSSGEARELYHEGIQLPPVRIREGGTPNEDIEQIIKNNSRIPEITLGDVRGQVGCTDVGVEKLQEIFAEYGVDVVQSCFETLLSTTHDRLINHIQDWPQTEISNEIQIDIPRDGESWTDDLASDEVLRYGLTIENTGEKLIFDFTDSDDEVELPINLRPHLIRSACYYSILGLTDSSISGNGGVAEICEIRTREGSAVNSVRPAPCNQYMYPLRAVTRLACRTLSQFVGDDNEILIADDSGSAGLSFGFETGEESEDEEVSVQYELPAASYGGSIGGDGASGVSMHLANIDITPIEIVESEFPNRVTRYDILPDSEGAGQYRGGFGVRREYTLEADTTFSYRASSSNVFPPQGAGGGQSPPFRTRCLIHDDDGERRLPTISSSQTLSKGDTVSIEFSGGGGYGDPTQREPEDVLRDYKNGFLSADRAREVYGVAIDITTDEILKNENTGESTAPKSED